MTSVLDTKTKKKIALKYLDMYKLYYWTDNRNPLGLFPLEVDLHIRAEKLTQVGGVLNRV